MKIDTVFDQQTNHFNLPDVKSSTCGYIIILQGSSGERILDWSSTIIQRSEKLALKEGSNSTVYLSCLFTEFLYDDFKPTNSKLKRT